MTHTTDLPPFQKVRDHIVFIATKSPWGKGTLGKAQEEPRPKIYLRKLLPTPLIPSSQQILSYLKIRSVSADSQTALLQLPVNLLTSVTNYLVHMHGRSAYAGTSFITKEERSLRQRIPWKKMNLSPKCRGTSLQQKVLLEKMLPLSPL